MEITLDKNSIFDGIMLSDGGLEKTFLNARFSLTCKYRSFMDAVISELDFLTWSPVNEKDRFDIRTNKEYHSCRVHSHVSEWLTKQHSRWYQSGKKIVPKDVIIDAKSVLWWYIGDGHLERKKARPRYRRITLATNSFTTAERIFLRDSLIKFLNSNDIYIECDSVIVIAKNAITAFTEKIGMVSPVVDYNYKFEFGEYMDSDYFHKSYSGRPIETINKYRKRNKVRELDYNKIKQEMQYV